MSYLDHTADKGPPAVLWRKSAGDRSKSADSVKGGSWGWGEVVDGGGCGGVVGGCDDNGDDNAAAAADADDADEDGTDGDTSFIFSFGEQSGASTRRSYPHPTHCDAASQEAPGKAWQGASSRTVTEGGVGVDAGGGAKGQEGECQSKKARQRKDWAGFILCSDR